MLRLSLFWSTLFYYTYVCTIPKQVSKRLLNCILDENV